MAKDFFYVRQSQLYNDFNIEPNKCKCRFNRNHTYSVNTTSIFDEKNKKNLITTLKIICNTCYSSVYYQIIQKVYEEDLNYT